MKKKKKKRKKQNWQEKNVDRVPPAEAQSGGQDVAGRLTRSATPSDEDSNSKHCS